MDVRVDGSLYPGRDERENGNNKTAFTNKPPLASCPAQSNKRVGKPNPKKMQQSEMGCPSFVFCLAGCPIPPPPPKKKAPGTVRERICLPGYRNHPSLASLLLSTGPLAVSGEPSRDKELGVPVGRMGGLGGWVSLGKGNGSE